MRLLNETKKAEIDWKKEVHVALTLEELATIYAVFASESTASTTDKLNEQGFEQVVKNIDVFSNDIPYTLYTQSEKLLEDEGVKLKDDDRDFY